MKTLAIIGSTGSIGESALKVYKKNKKSFKLITLAANTNLNKNYHIGHIIPQKDKEKFEKIFKGLDVNNIINTIEI